MKTVIEMAKEAGFTQPEGETWYEAFPQCIERFAELVRADAIAEEREVCAKVCEEMRTYVGRNNAVTQSSAQECAAAIRARSNT